MNNQNIISFVICLLNTTILVNSVFTKGKTWKTTHTNSRCFCQHTMLAMVWKSWYTIDMSYIIQATLPYQHSAPNTGLLHYPSFYVRDIDYRNLLNRKKEGSKILIFLIEICFHSTDSLVFLLSLTLYV